jgi:tetratricopeptide (TPR) repeat protein
MKNARFRIIINFLLAAVLLAYPVSAIAQENNPGNSPLTCALLLANKLDPKYGVSRNNSLSHIAVVSWAIGKPRQALRAVRAMECAEQAYTSNYLADQAMKAGQNGYALKFIEQSLGCAIKQDFYQKDSLFSQFVAKLIKLKRYAQALTVAEAIDDQSSNKALAFVLLADAYLKAGQDERALILLDSAFAKAKTADEDYSYVTCEALGEIALGYAQLAKPDQADAALSFAVEIAGKEANSCVKSIVAICFAKAGQEERALQLAESLDDDRCKTEAVIQIASIHFRRGKNTKALALLSQIERMIELEDDYENSKGSVFAELAKVYLQAYMPEKAAQVARKISDDFYCYKAALEIADWSLKHGHANLGTDALDWASQKIRLIVSEKPEEITGNMSTSRAKEKAAYLSEISYKYVEARQFDKAQQAIDAIDLPQWRAGKLADLAAARFHTSQRNEVKVILSQALHLSESSAEYPHDSEKYLTLANIARRYAETGYKKQATKVFVDVLGMAHELKSYNNRIVSLAEIGFSYEKAGLKADDRIRDALRRIIKDWTQD